MKGKNHIMNQDFLQLLQKNNTQSGQKSLSERLCEPDRFKNFSAQSNGLLLDFSRTTMGSGSMQQLLTLAAKCGVEEARQRLFAGEDVNFTENRPALHMAMRSDELPAVINRETAARVTENRQMMFRFASSLAAGHLPGRPEQAVRHIIHIGIGGSVLGPRLLIEALGVDTSVKVHFLASIDAHLRTELLAALDPAETAVMVVTKSFTTGETLLHARRVLDWMEQAIGSQLQTMQILI